MIRTAITILFFFTIQSGYGWGPTGHRATGLVAGKYLNAKAKKKLENIFHGESVAMLSTWMDEVRSDSTFKHMDDWHWVTIPEGMTYEQTTKNENGDLIQTLTKVIAALKSKNLTAEEEKTNIKILIHLMGDLHQPLHVGAKQDRGGNDVKVIWFKNDSNLHRVWDSEMIDDTKLSYTELAQSLENPARSTILSWQRTTIVDIAKESQSYNPRVYDIGNGKLGYQYSYYNFPTVRLRILQAGVRLAGILNEIYGK